MDDLSAATAIQPYIQSGERILWAGRPGRGLRLRSSDIFLVPFSLMWGGFAIFWESQVVNTDGPVFMKLWGIPFVLVGLHLIGGRFFWDAWVRSKQIYALTNQRLMILRGQSLKSSSLRSLPQLTLNSRMDGTGTISFVSLFGRLGNFGAWSPARLGTSFLYLQNADEVFALIIKAQTADKY
jgi:hypothetical protein